MNTISLRIAQRDLLRLVESVIDSDDPLEIVGPHGRAVLVSAEVWRDTQEPLFLLSIPGLRESLKEQIRG
ncbi:MAG: type II toxin-antitoxin system Phd/YefM family antitoxin, partial [bacterium]